MKIPETYHDLLKDETKAFVFLATVMEDGSPQVTPVWFSFEQDQILINTAEGRTKDINMRARPAVALVIQDPNDTYRYLQIRGPVTKRIYKGADEHINNLAIKYTGKGWDFQPGQKRVIYQISPEHLDMH